MWILPHLTPQILMGPCHEPGGVFIFIQPRDSGHARARRSGAMSRNADAVADAVAGGAVQGEEKDMVRPLFPSPPPLRPARSTRARGALLGDSPS